ncbi:MAG: hypothetical protein Q9215_005600 [Flavoplaca cf. flavocitrina]
MSSAAQDQPVATPATNVKPTNSSLLEDIVEIKVGPSDRIFKAHRGLLCERASYFKAILGNPGNWKENHEGLALKEVKPEIFQRFLLWLYFGNILDNNETAQSVAGTTLIHCYFFADERGVPGMHNHVIDTFLARIETTEIIFTKYQRLIWVNTPDGAPLRRLLVDALAMMGTNIPEVMQTEEDQEQYDKSFITDVLVAKCKHPMTINLREFVKRRCEYHIHDEREAKCA